MEAIEIDIADIEGHIHAGAEQSEIDRTERAFDLRHGGFQLRRLQHVGGEGLDVLAFSGERIEPVARPRRGGDGDAGGRKPPQSRPTRR